METLNIYQKLFNAKKEIGAISKDSTNPFFKSKYFDVNQLLQHVEPILDKHSLLLLQPLGNGGVSSIIYDIDSKDIIESFMMLPNIQDPQKLGSAITYFRRYTLQSLLGLQAEDDDGNKAAKPANKPNATNDALDKAKEGGYTLAQVQSKYKLTSEQIKTFNESK